MGRPRVPEVWHRCVRCGQGFLASRHRRRTFCSKVCVGANARASERTGAKNPRYNGGLCQDTGGRWRIMCRDGTQMFFYRGVMAAYIGRLLEPHELIHHLNGDPTDDRLENLQITTRREHPTLHKVMATA